MNKKVLAVVVLDESGSMGMIRGKTISCLNEYIQSLQPQGKMCHMTLVKFSTGNVTNLCNDVPVKDVPEITERNYIPNGGTPLLDAVGSTIRDIESRVKNSKDNPDILFIVMTDGEENSSHQYDQRQIIEMISEKEKSGWTFVYLGANQDSWKSASNIGYANTNNVANFVATPDGLEMAMSSLRNNTQTYFSDRQQFYRSAMSSGISCSGLNYQSKDFYSKDKNKKKGGDKKWQIR